MHALEALFHFVLNVDSNKLINFVRTVVTNIITICTKPFSLTLNGNIFVSSIIREINYMDQFFLRKIAVYLNN